jgi:transcription termination/antitermination protein NusA
VNLDSINKKAEVIVPDDQLSLAIGKAGQNVRLAAKLTGWHIDIKSHSDKKAQAEQSIAQAEQQALAAAAPEAAAPTVSDLTQLPSVGDKLQQELISKGFDSLDKIAKATVDELTQVPGIGQKKAEKILEAAKELVKGA